MPRASTPLASVAALSTSGREASARGAESGGARVGARASTPLASLATLGVSGGEESASAAEESASGGTQRASGGTRPARGATEPVSGRTESPRPSSFFGPALAGVSALPTPLSLSVASAASGVEGRAAARTALALVALLATACGGEDTSAPVVIDLRGETEVTRTFAVDGERAVTIVVGDAPIVVEAWADGGAWIETPDAQLATGASAAWLAPRATSGELDTVVTGDGDVALTAWARGTPPPATVDRDRSLAWFDPALLDDASAISFARVLAAIADDGHGGSLLARWFSAFADGPGAGRATFAQFLGEVTDAQGADPTAWDLAALPFRVTGVHDRLDLARGDDCGELRVSVASTHATFSPVHLIFLFRQVPTADDVTPDGRVHCRGTARRWADLSALAGAAWLAAARDVLATGVTRDRFALAESVELSLSPWQWRQWISDGAGGLTNPTLFQTVDTDRVNAPGGLHDAFLAEVAANAPAIAARTWTIPPQFRAPVVEVQPNAVAALPDLAGIPDALAAYPELPRALGMVGCPRCHTDDADFLQTSIERVPSPFYDKELDARAARLEALVRGEHPGDAPFGPLQGL
jgi:hypothetical protein